MATPVETNRLTHPTAGRLQPAEALPPLNGKETALRQMGNSPMGVSHASTRLPQASYNAPLEIRAKWTSVLPSKQESVCAQIFTTMRFCAGSTLGLMGDISSTVSGRKASACPQNKSPEPYFSLSRYHIFPFSS